ncbi:phytoene desaturase [Salinisphaera sp. Q1T1-3]|nr:phytoene desaturase [Salinisphaera sp. Q1T1-3]
MQETLRASARRTIARLRATAGRTTPRRAVIIGAGPGGLATAMLLAAQGAEVTLLERENRVGGRTSSLVMDGFTFDLGPTFFLYPEILSEIFTACGRRFEDEVALVRLDPMYRLIFEAGGSILASHDVARLQAEVARFSARDAEQVPAFLAANRIKFDAFRPLLQRPFASLRDLSHPDVLKALPLMRPLSSVDTDLKRWFEHPQVRLAFSFQSKYLGMSPFKCPSLFTILSHVEHGYGVYHPIGGCGAISEAMARVARDMGVDIRLSEPVQRIEFEGRKAVGAITGQGFYPADAMVVNADFAGAMHKMVPDRLRRKWTDARIEKKQYSCSTCMLYLGIEGDYPELHHHTIHLSADYLDDIRAIEDQRAPKDPTLYIQNASQTDPTLAPAGHSTIYMLAPVGNLGPDGGPMDWTEMGPRYRDLMLNRLARLLHIDRAVLDARIQTEHMITPADWATRYELYRGATFNLAHNIGQMLHWRPNNRFEDLDRVYLTGGGTHPGSGLPTIFESARIAARLIDDDLKLSRKGVLS